MKLQVVVWVEDRETDFVVQAPTLPEAFALIPQESASRGFALVNTGQPVDYQVAIIT